LARLRGARRVEQEVGVDEQHVPVGLEAVGPDIIEGGGRDPEAGQADTERVGMVAAGAPPDATKAAEVLDGANGRHEATCK